MTLSSPAISPTSRPIFRTLAALVAFALLAIALQVASFGDPNRGADETFYFLAGQRMHQGLLPYVDIWDRKPLGLFVLYYLIAGISTSVMAYQIAACLFTAMTATVICLIVSRFAGFRGGVPAGLTYLLLLGPFDGNVGQSSDFYNLFMASAALLIVQEREGLARGLPGWRLWLAMALCGLAITIKQTTLFESLFLGLWVVAVLAGAGAGWRRIAAIAGASMLLGALPTLMAAGYYWQIGHWSEFWHAMVTSNLTKGAVGGEARQSFGIAMRAVPLVACAAWGLSLREVDPWLRRFMIGWIVAALIGFVAVPNFYGHYFLPVLVPLSVAAGLLFGLHARGTLLFALLAAFALLWMTLPDRRTTTASIASTKRAAALIDSHDPGDGLLIYDGAHALYSLTGKRFLSPLVFPQHLNHRAELNVSHLDTHAEINRILAAGPGAVVMTRVPTYLPVDVYGRRRVADYVAKRCRLVGAVAMSGQPVSNPHLIFGDCGLARGR